MSEGYDEALADARARYLADVATALVPHNAIAGAMGESFVESVKDVKEQDLKEVGDVVGEAKEKLDRLQGEALQEWMALGKDFRKDILEKIDEHDPEAKGRLKEQLEGLDQALTANGLTAKAAIDGANEALQAALTEALENYKATMDAATDGYEEGFKAVLESYRSQVEGVLTAEAEARAREEAERKAAEVAAALAAKAAADAAAAAAAAPVAPAGYPYYPDPAAAAYYAEMQRARQEAEAQRIRAEQAEAAMRVEIRQSRRRRAVRRGIVGGIVLGKILD